LFSSQLSVNPRTGEVRRHHLHPSGPQKAVRATAFSAGIQRRVTCHVFRHSLATYLLESGYDIRAVQGFLGHKNLKTTMTGISNQRLEMPIKPPALPVVMSILSFSAECGLYP
jgi:site-specific recombinase XerD